MADICPFASLLVAGTSLRFSDSPNERANCQPGSVTLKKPLGILGKKTQVALELLKLVGAVHHVVMPTQILLQGCRP